MYQTIIIVGNVGRDPELRYLPSGQAVTNFTVATNRVSTDANGQQVKETTWFRISAWGKTAEACNNYLRKGKSVLVEGRLICDSTSGGPRIYTRQDGKSGASFEVSANTVRFLSARGEQGEGEEAAAETTEDEIPF